MKTEWVFYQEGNPDMVETMKTGIEKKGNQYFFSPSYEPHDVATVIKNYFQDLEEPAFPFSLYKSFVTCSLDVTKTKELLDLLPTPNRIILQVFIHLYLIFLVFL